MDGVSDLSHEDEPREQERIGRGGRGLLKGVGHSKAEVIRELPLGQQLEALDRAGVGVAEDRRVGIDPQWHGRHEPVEALHVDARPERDRFARAEPEAQLVLRRLLEADVGVAAAEASRASRVVERGVNQELVVGRPG